jgi:hypothetical protein
MHMPIVVVVVTFPGFHHFRHAPQEKERPNAHGDESKALGIIEGQIQKLVDRSAQGPLPFVTNMEREDMVDGVLDLDGFCHITEQSEAAGI